LQGWYNVEAHLWEALWEPSPREAVDVDAAEKIDAVVGHYRAALPFDEPEGRWLLQTYDEVWGTDSIARIRSHPPVEIVAGGLRRVIAGRDLLRRWWAWRRQTDEFRGQGTLGVACDALRDLIKTVSPDVELTPAHYVLKDPGPDIGLRTTKTVGN
jgi:hypothetical protein